MYIHLVFLIFNFQYFSISVDEIQPHSFGLYSLLLSEKKSSHFYDIFNQSPHVFHNIFQSERKSLAGIRELFFFISAPSRIRLHCICL